MRSPTKSLINALYSNKEIWDKIYSTYIEIIWIDPKESLSLQMLHYSCFYLQLENGLITTKYNLIQMSQNLRFPLAELRVFSHQLHIELDHHFPRDQHIWKFWNLDVEFEEHFIFTCLVYYEIHGRYYCLFINIYTLKY